MRAQQCGSHFERRKELADMQLSPHGGSGMEQASSDDGTPEGTRTPSPQNRNLMLYPLSHGRLTRYILAQRSAFVKPRSAANPNTWAAGKKQKSSAIKQKLFSAKLFSAKSLDFIILFAIIIELDVSCPPQERSQTSSGAV